MADLRAGESQERLALGFQMLQCAMLYRVINLLERPKDETDPNYALEDPDDVLDKVLSWASILGRTAQDAIQKPGIVGDVGKPDF